MDNKKFIKTILLESGDIIRQSYGEVLPAKRKIEKSQLVTEIDVASERLLIERIIRAFPHSGIIAEESGYIPSRDDSYWIIDPIDGTSNFANALPWFGIMIALIKNHAVHDSGIYLPITDELYLASQAEGAYKNDKKITVPRDVNLADSLISICFSSTEETIDKEIDLVKKLSPHILNIRTTNSAYDYAYAAEGKLACVINLSNKIWDIAPVMLIAKEAGMHVSDSEGNPLRFSLTEELYEKNYTFCISNPFVWKEMKMILQV